MGQSCNSSSALAVELESRSSEGGGSLEMATTRGELEVEALGGGKREEAAASYCYCSRVKLRCA